VTTEPGSGVPAGPDEPTSADAPVVESTSELLSSMLSRAVEGQLDEQRELAGAIDDMRTQLISMGRQLADVRVRTPRDEATDAQINTVTAELREAVRFLSERLDGVTRMLALRGEEFADVRTSLGALDAQIRSQMETISALTQGVEAAAAASDNREVLARLDTMEATLATKADNDLGERLVAVGAGIEAAIDAAVAPLAQRLTEISAATAAQSATLTQLQSRLDPMASDITAIGGNVSGLVEGSAASVALDARVNESVTDAMRETERRLTVHIDEAVLALAEALLRRRISQPARSAAAPAAAPAIAEADAEPRDAERADTGPDVSAVPEASADDAAELVTDQTSGAEPEPSPTAEVDLSSPASDVSETPETDEVGAEPQASDAVEAVEAVDAEVAEVAEPAIQPDSDTSPLSPPVAWWEQEMATIEVPSSTAAPVVDDPDIDVTDEMTDASGEDDPETEFDADDSPDSGGLEPHDDPYSTAELPRVLATADTGPAEGYGSPADFYDAARDPWSPEPASARPAATPGDAGPVEDDNGPKRRRRWF
jgi:prefoldin subunit 5